MPKTKTEDAHRTNIRVPHRTHQQLLILKAATGKSMEEMVYEALVAYTKNINPQFLSSFHQRERRKQAPLLGTATKKPAIYALRKHRLPTDNLP